MNGRHLKRYSRQVSLGVTLDYTLIMIDVNGDENIILHIALMKCT